MSPFYRVIGVVAYQDGGFIAMEGIHIGGAVPGTALDNIKLTIDVVGSNGEADGIGGVQATDYVNSNYGGTRPDDEDIAVADGDLVIALRQVDVTETVDFGFGIDKISLRKEGTGTGNVANSAANGTVLVSNLSMAGYFGPIDIIIQEEVGADETPAMNINAYFNVTKGAVKFDFVNTSMNFSIHNSRGTDSNAASLAHVQMEVGKGVSSAATGSKEALAFNISDFSADIDLTDITIGQEPSIGNLYITDLVVSADMVVYGH